MKSQRSLLVVILILSATAVLTLIMLRPAAQTLSQEKPEDEDPPTKIQSRTRTFEQIQHGKIFRQSDKTRSLIKNRDKDITSIIGEPWDDVSNSAEGRLDINDMVARMACSSDAVAMIKVLEKNSQFTNDDKSLFTDYKVEVREAYKDKGFENITAGSILTVSRSGGAVEVDGHLIRVYDKSYKAIRVGGTYVLFLKYNSVADTFTPTDRDGTFKLEADALVPYNDIPPRFEWQKVKPEALKNMIDASRERCQK